ncbi:MAG TPA: hypothetical protein VHL58_13025 [Thermoanaerobaculia bacterium]|nr:hypothetical protein [Thermoanaerobaculia bacterium]
MTPKEIWKKSAAMAATAPANVVTGAVGLVAAAAMWNPLPLILWGLGSATWVALASTSKKYSQRVLDEKRTALEQKAEHDREELRSRIDSRLCEPPFSDWIATGQLRNPLEAYPRLVEIRGRLASLARERTEIEFLTELGILQQINDMLSSYLQLVKARMQYLRLLRDSRVRDPQPSQPPQRGKKPSPIVLRIPSFGECIQEISVHIAELKTLAEKEPITASAREWHIGILEKQRELLAECEKRDLSAAAQLEAFPDAFEMILARLSTPQLDAGEITRSLGNIVTRVEETERFVDMLGPAVENALGPSPGASVPN